ncbi:MAG: hypothetical protein R2724_00460 [Bryobacterales bacterium]
MPRGVHRSRRGKALGSLDEQPEIIGGDLGEVADVVLAQYKR